MALHNPSQYAGQKRKRPDQSSLKRTGKARQAGQRGDSDTSSLPTTSGGQTNRTASKARQAALELPVRKHTDSIVETVTSRPITLLTGATGSGKSTQLPQILLPHLPPGTRIAITQPRRVAAISLAKRVALEMDSPQPGHPQSKVGYSVRFDQKVGPKCQVKFLTEGMLLKEVLTDSTLSEYGVVIVDEVHERSVGVDLLLGFLRMIVQQARSKKSENPLRIVVMSATADLGELSRFFNDGWKQSQSVDQNERIHSPAIVSNGGAEEQNEQLSKKKRRRRNGRDIEIPSMNGEKVEAVDNSSSSNENRNDHSTIDDQSPDVGLVQVEGRQYPVSIEYLSEPTSDFPESSVKTIFEIHYKEPLPGDILVFLTGQDVVESVESLVKEYASVMDSSLPRLHILPLFAALPQAAQQEVFEPTPPGHRKVVLATNIAETSVTIPGVRYVVDCGLAKVKEFRSQLGLDSLLVKPISKSSATQRTGRAGREAPGKAFRLYTKADFDGLTETAAPEILRCDLASAILAVKARGITDVTSFPFLTSPRIEHMRKALLQLYRLGALQDDGQISDTGKKMARMPLSPALARVLLWAGRSGALCVLSVVDIISCLSVENVFLHVTTEERKEEAEAKRRELYRREGDHLTLLATVGAYAAASDRKLWCRDHFVSWRAMRNVMDVRKQLRELCLRERLVPKDMQMDQQDSVDAVAKNPELGIEVLKCFLRGFVGNVARLMPDGSYRTVEGNQIVAIHPSSVLFGRKVEALLYNELVFTMKSYARGVSAIQLDWYGDAAEDIEGDKGRE